MEEEFHSSSAKERVHRDHRRLCVDSESDDLAWSLMTCREHEISPDGIIRFAVPGGRDVAMYFDIDALTAASERIEIQDDRLSLIWGDHVYRIILNAKVSGKSGTAYIKIKQA